jgi:hypothetical protein
VQKATEECVLLAQQWERTDKAVTKMRLEQMARDMESLDLIARGRSWGGGTRSGQPELARRYEEQIAHSNCEFGERRMGDLEVPVSALPGNLFQGLKGRDLEYGWRNVWTTSPCIECQSGFG